MSVGAVVAPGYGAGPEQPIVRAMLERLAADGIAVVERAEVAGRRTAFVHPRDAHGILLQLWEEKDFGGPRRP